MSKAPAATGFCVIRDGDGHWYLIPAAKREHWDTWFSQDRDEAPEYAIELPGSPSDVTFESYTIR